MQAHAFNWKWTLADAVFTKDKGKVFSCFAGGGGSTMGYKLAGFDVIGCNEIDPRMMDVYCRNHAPALAFIEDIRQFKDRTDLPAELYNLDILDGSPPCSVFSTAGLRKKAWGKKKRFREGQAEQVLDTLFFDFIALAKRLRPKVVIAENVKGLLIGACKDYARRIYAGFDDAGYHCRHWLLDASKMGVPQRRERVFFICLRKDLATPFLSKLRLFSFLELDLGFYETPIAFGEVADFKGDEITGKNFRHLWENRREGDHDQGNACMRLYGKDSFFNNTYACLDKVCPTLTAQKMGILHFAQPKCLSRGEICGISTFPQDYDFGRQTPHYVCGMSMPPVMTAQIARRVWEQWLSKIKQ